MGYYTEYTLEYQVPEQAKAKEITEFEAQCREAKIAVPIDIKIAVSEQLSLEVSLEEALNGEEFGGGYGPLMEFVIGAAESCKWYDHEKDMKELSKEFPTVLFTLHGEGEESGDLWRAYFKGGKSHKTKARIVFDEFKESFLT